MATSMSAILIFLQFWHYICSFSLFISDSLKKIFIFVMILHANKHMIIVICSQNSTVLPPMLKYMTKSPVLKLSIFGSMSPTCLENYQLIWLESFALNFAFYSSIVMLHDICQVYMTWQIDFLKSSLRWNWNRDGFVML